MRPRRAQAAGPTAAYVIAAVLFCTAAISPATFRGWMQEDAWAEWATFLAFALAAWRLAARARHTTDGTPREVWAERAVWLGLGLFCVFVAGEEVSWGQRLFAFRPPDVFLEKNFQQELNLHNFLKGKDVGGAKLDSRYLVAAAALGYGVIAPLLKAALKSGALARAARPAPPEALVPLFVAVAAFELVYPVPLTGEAAELVLGLAFLVAAPPHAARSASLPFAAVAGGVVLSLLVPLVLYGDDEETSARARAELETLAAELEEGGLVTERLATMRSVHKRLFTARQAGYVELRGEDRYFLDPWANPYWLLWSKKRGRLLLYSFGANRRRDLSPRQKGLGDRGDDVVVDVTIR